LLNLGQLLLAPPLGENVFRIDPGLIVVKLFVWMKKEIYYTTKYYPHAPQNETTMAMKR
jgi:uncharacterized protein